MAASGDSTYYGGDWWAQIDATSGNTYYHNTITMETSWTPPVIEGGGRDSLVEDTGAAAVEMADDDDEEEEEEGGEGGEAEEEDESVPNPNADIGNASGWLIKKKPRTDKFQKRFVKIIDGKELAYFKAEKDKKPCKKPVDLMTLRVVRIPSSDEACRNKGFDLVFIDKTMTFIEEPDKASRAFGRVLRSLRVPAQSGAHLKDSRGRDLLIIKCTGCASMQGVRSSNKAPKCTNCNEPLDIAKAQESAAVKKKVDTNTIQCGVCGRWLRYPEGSHEVMCVCAAVLQIGAGHGAGTAKRSKADLELLKKIAEMEKRCGADDELIARLRAEIQQLKQLAESQGIVSAARIPGGASSSTTRGGGFGQQAM